MPPPSPGTLVFASLAMNQARFFHAVGTQAEKAGYRAAHICFHEGSHEHLRAQGALSFNAFREGGAPAQLSDYPIEHLNLLLGHEKAAYELTDSTRQIIKLRRHLAAMSAIFDRVEREAPPPVRLVQELGGFLSVLAAFFEARRRGIPNVFIEPSFFRGRICFLRDSLAALPIPGPSGAPLSGEVEAYLADALAQQRVVVPTKDRRHYRAPARKLFDTHNMRRLVQKTVDKYVHARHEEFEHIGGHVRRHLRMFWTNRRLVAHYRPVPERQPFIYYPLHVPADFALTIRSPEYLDQLGLLGFLARAVPHPYRLAVKEHPALVGAVPLRRMRELLDEHDNLTLLDPGVKNYEVMRHAAAVVTVNSKSGAEALLLGKPVVVLGDAFYRVCSLVHPVDRLHDVPDILHRVVYDANGIDPAAIRGYFQDVWSASWPGELYDMTPDNIARFSHSLHSYLAAH
jgi:hypothetical protein